MSQSNGVCFPTWPTSINEKIEAKSWRQRSVNKPANELVNKPANESVNKTANELVNSTALITAVETSGIQQLQKKMAGRQAEMADVAQMTCR